MKADIIKARADCQPQYAALSDADEPLEKILDDLGLDQLCCRVRIMTNVEFNSIW
jgi:DNA-directed RNA polymerase subunit N (RpoN/RPB10)